MEGTVPASLEQQPEQVSHTLRLDPLELGKTRRPGAGPARWNGQVNYAYTIGLVTTNPLDQEGDKISITITSPTGAVVFSTGGFQTLKGGNVRVH